MPYYTDDVIAEVRGRNDIVDVISQYVHLQKRGSTYFGLCPFHSEKTASFSVTPSKQMYYCFGCHAGGSVINFLQNYENISFPEALKILADRAGYALPEGQQTDEMRRKNAHMARLLEIQKEAGTYFYRLLRSEKGKTAMAYFKGRGLSDETMQAFGLGYADKYSNDLYEYLKEHGYSDRDLKDSGLVTISEKHGPQDKFWNRAMFPIMDERRRVVAFGGRVLGDGEPKYLNSPETEIFHKSELLYGMHEAVRKSNGDFILCEGYMDVISLHQAGFHQAVASLGTALTAQHAALIRRKKRTNVYLSYDSDNAGVSAALRAIPILAAAGVSSKIVDLTPYKDPDELIKACGSEEYQKRLDEAENSFLFRMRMMQRDYDMSDPEGKSRFYDHLANRLAIEFSDEMTRDNYIEAAADTFHISYTQLKKKVDLAGTNLQEGLLQDEDRTYVAGGEAEREMSRPKSGVKRPTKEDGIKQSQRLLLTWLVEYPNLYAQIKAYVTPEDFSEGIYREVATELFAQFEEGRAIDPASILDHYEEDADVRLIAEIFNTSVGEIEKDEDMQKAVTETLYRVKQASLAWYQKHMDTTDPEAFSKFMAKQKEVNDVRNLRISLK